MGSMRPMTKLNDEVDIQKKFLEGLTAGKLDSMSQRRKNLVLQQIVKGYLGSLNEQSRLGIALQDYEKKINKHVVVNGQLFTSEQVEIKFQEILDKIKYLEEQLDQSKNSESLEYNKLKKEHDILVVELLKIQKSFIVKDREMKQQQSDLFFFKNNFLDLQKKVIYLISKNNKKELRVLKEQSRIGAEERLKNEYSYVVGEILVKNSGHIKNVVKIPYLLAKNTWNYNKKSIKYMIPIDEYQDVANAEAVKKHLSYRLGSILLDGDQMLTKKKIFKIMKELIDFKSN